MVSSAGINRVACSKLLLDQYLLLIHKNVDDHRVPKIVCDTFEAIIGGIYYDCGLKKVYATVMDVFHEIIESGIDTIEHISDSKTILQEVCHKYKWDRPLYQSTEHGPGHKKYYKTYLKVVGKTFGPSESRSKKDSEKTLAFLALEYMRNQNLID